MSYPVRKRIENRRRFGNGLTLKELSEIEEAAHHSTTDEARTIVRLAAALREAMQIEESAVALISIAKAQKKPSDQTNKTTNTGLPKKPGIAPTHSVDGSYPT